ncbi:MAG: MBL fold metallo-hydrolase [Candidatus Micrarchaeota archaeon]|nr:MBL fold metallo-hydrolase [Candidatus Micrarchaeota archaeon]
MAINIFEHLNKIDDRVYYFSTVEFLCSNIYLLFEKPVINSNFIMIDAGNGIPKIPVEPRITLLTHGHYDHTKGIDLSWKNVYLHEMDLLAPEDLTNLFYVPNNALPLKFEELKVFDYNFEIYHTPGHTKGSVCILEKNLKILFSGDTYFGNGIFGRTDLGGNLDDLQRSINLISELDYDILCPGHGEIIYNENY